MVAPRFIDVHTDTEFNEIQEISKLTESKCFTFDEKSIDTVLKFLNSEFDEFTAENINDYITLHLDIIEMNNMMKGGHLVLTDDNECILYTFIDDIFIKHVDALPEKENIYTEIFDTNDNYYYVEMFLSSNKFDPSYAKEIKNYITKTGYKGEFYIGIDEINLVHVMFLNSSPVHSVPSKKNTCARFTHWNDKILHGLETIIYLILGLRYTNNKQN